MTFFAPVSLKKNAPGITNSCISIIVIFSVFHACDVFCGAAGAGLKPVSLYTERLHLKPTRSRSGIPKKLLIPSTWPITFPIHTYCIHDYPDGDIKCRCLKCRIPQGNNNVLYIVNSVYTLNFIACEPELGTRHICCCCGLTDASRVTALLFYLVHASSPFLITRRAFL